jgi:DNA repair protein RadC
MAHDPSSSIDSSFLFVRDVAGTYRPADADEVLQAAQQLLWQRLRGSETLSSPQAVRDFLSVRLGRLEHELFAVLMLDAQHALIEYVELFRGTVSQTSVYPREIVKESLARNAAALMLVHNHRVSPNRRLRMNS